VNAAMQTANAQQATPREKSFNMAWSASPACSGIITYRGIGVVIPSAQSSAASIAAATMLAAIGCIASSAAAPAAPHGAPMHRAAPVFRPSPAQYGAPHGGNGGPVHVAPAYTPPPHFQGNPEFHRVNPGFPPNNAGALRPNLPLNAPSALRPNFPAANPGAVGLTATPGAAAPIQQGATPSPATTAQPAVSQPAAGLTPGSQPVVLRPLPKASPGAFAQAKPAFPAVQAHDRFWPLHKDSHFMWLRGQRRLFTPVALLGVVLIDGAYWYPDAYVSTEGPACTGVTADGCQLQWRPVDLEDGGAEPQCVQYCPQAGPPPDQVATLPPPAPIPQGGTCQTTIYSEPNFHGNSAPTGDSQPVLSPTGWQNEIQSVVVRAGTWDFFADENYGGESLRLGPGTYPMLAPEWTRHIGSFMCVEPGQPPA
jgi:hypothetical protein